MSAVRKIVNMKNDQSLTRSDSVPDTIDAVVATNTIWNNQMDIVE